MTGWLYRSMLIVSFVVFGCQSATAGDPPKDFVVTEFATGLPEVRAMVWADADNLFAGSKAGNIYHIDAQGQSKIIISGLQMPVGVDYFAGDLYVAEISRVLVYKNILQQLAEPQQEVIRDDLPTDTWHGWKFIKVGPDERLYVPVGAPCNVCLRSDARYASILRMDLDGGNLEVFAHGVRNTVGFDWHPDDRVLWFTDNGRDHMGDDLPPDELNRAAASGLHFGFPFLHGSDVQDPEYYSQRPFDDFTLPKYNMQAHVAALGMRFYTAKQFPQRYQQGIFIAQHGSWNRSSKIGYRVLFVELSGNEVKSAEVFLDVWREGETVFGRPADVEIGPNGSLYISDDYGDRIYKVSYEPANSDGK
jgi:glucose/arabinose dehydrogenase